MIGYVIAILSYFLMAVVTVIDKFLMSGKVSDPKKYVFFIGVLTSLLFLLIPFGFFQGITLGSFLWGFFGGITRLLATWVLFILLQKGDASKVSTTIGGMVPLFSLGLTFVFFGVNLTPMFFLAFFLLVAGSLIASFNKNGKISGKQIYMSAISAGLFSASFIFLKQSFLDANFWASLIAFAFGTAFFSLSMFLLNRKFRKSLFEKESAEVYKKVGLLFLVGQFLGAGAGILQNLSVDMVPAENIALVNALEGSKYAFIFVMAFLLSFRLPKVFDRKNTFQKVISIIVITIGMYFVFKL
jgi:drug/metabolite transporter (DMT)-like permease